MTEFLTWNSKYPYMSTITGWIPLILFAIGASGASFLFIYILTEAVEWIIRRFFTVTYMDYYDEEESKWEITSTYMDYYDEEKSKWE